MVILVVILLFVNLPCSLDKYICILAEQVSEPITRQHNTISQESYYDDVTDDVYMDTWNMYGENGYYYYNDMNNKMPFEEIDIYLKDNETKDFLNSFQNSLQREVISKQLRYCPFISLCNFSFGLVNQDQIFPCCSPCSCNISNCLIYQTCCPDILNSTMFNLDSTRDPKDDMGSNYNNGRRDDLLSCTLLHAKRRPLVIYSSAYMHATCPSSANSSLVNMCTRQYTKDTVASLEDMIPVMVSGQVISYRNKYCAFCNGVSSDEISFWDINLSCLNISIKEITKLVPTEKLLINFVLSADTCDLSFEPRDPDQSQSCPSAISRCNESGLLKKYDPELELGCSLYTSVIYAYSQVFKNVFCLMCNGYEPRVPLKVCDQVPGAGESFSFSGLIKRRAPSNEAKQTNNKVTCNESAILDTTTVS